MIFLDTSFLFAFYSARDERHDLAQAMMKDIANGKYGHAYLSDYVFDELITTVFSRLKNLQEAIRVGKSLRSTVDFLYVGIDEFESAWKIFSDQRTTSLSFTDCTIAALMKANGIDRIATFDADFKGIKGISAVNA
ncbi:MAG: type II toxin-antitoxin system VapC family toxin [Candidatus Micrarchaeales archaeon]